MVVKKNVLVLFAHPNQSDSIANKFIRKSIESLEGVTFEDLYSKYPRFEIDVDDEQKLLVEHDAIFFMFPMFWYSTPSILKEWQDLVLEHGFAYGSGGDQLHGKHFGSIITTGGSREDYSVEGKNHCIIPEFLKPLESMAALCGMHYLPPMTLFAGRRAKEDGRLDQYALALVEMLSAYVNDKFDFNSLSSSDDVEKLLGGAE